MSPEAVVHLALRVPHTVEINRQKTSLIELHNSAFEKKLALAVGKFGATIAEPKTTIFKDSIIRGLSPHLVLITKKDDSFTGYSAPIIDLGKSIDRRDLADIAPDYYKLFDRKPIYYFKVGDQFKRCALKHFKLKSNNRSLLSVISECRTSSMLIYGPSKCDAA